MALMSNVEMKARQKCAPAHEVSKNVESIQVGHLATSVDVTPRH